MNCPDPKPEWYELAIADDKPHPRVPMRDWLLIAVPIISFWGCVGATLWWAL